MFRILGLRPGTIPPSWEAILARVHPDDRAVLVAFHEQGLKGEALPEIDYRQPLTSTKRSCWRVGGSIMSGVSPRCAT
jgi:hypothetical protein